MRITPEVGWVAPACTTQLAVTGTDAGVRATSEEFKPAARVAVAEEKGVGVTEVACFPVVDQGPQGVSEQGREGPWARAVTFQRLDDLQFLGQVGAAAEGHAREAGELGEARVRAQRHDALGGRHRAAAQRAPVRQLPQLALLLLLEEPPLRQVVLPAQGQPPQRRLQVVRAWRAWRARLLTTLLGPAEETR